MKTLFLVRHAKAVPRGPGIGDMKRSLVEEGRADARILAKLMKGEGLRPDALYSSSADRALETAQIFAEELKFPAQSIILNDAIYDEGAEGLFALARKFDDQHNSIMIFGHNPSLTDFAALLIKGFNKSIPKSGMVCVTFKPKRWNKISVGQGRLEQFVVPSKKDREAAAFDALRKDLQEILAQEIESVLADVHVDTSSKMFKLIRKASRKLAKSFVKISKESKDFKEAALGKIRARTEEKPEPVAKQRKRVKSVDKRGTARPGVRKSGPPRGKPGTSKKQENSSQL